METLQTSTKATHLNKTKMQTGRIQRQQECKNELKERTYSVLIKELSKNLQSQKENPGKLVATVFYYNDESAAHKIVKEIYIGNILKTSAKELTNQLSNISEDRPFLKIVYSCCSDAIEEFERLKLHPFIEAKQENESSNDDNIVNYVVNCGKDVEQAAEITALICVDVLGITPFFLCEKGQEIDCLIAPFITVVVDTSDNADLTWNEYKNRIDKMVDYGPIIDNFLRNAKL